MMMMPKVMMIKVEEGVSAFLNPVRGADNIRTSLGSLEEFDNDDDDDYNYDYVENVEDEVVLH